MADTTFIITPSGDEYSMVSDDFFNSLEGKQYSESVSPDIALDWLLNVKKFYLSERSSKGCITGIYEAEYEIKDHKSYANPVTDFSKSYKTLKIGGSDTISYGGESKVLQTSPRNPHKYTLKKEEGYYSDNAPLELTGEYLGAFFHHKGGWYASFDDADDGGGENLNTNEKEITQSKKLFKSNSAHSIKKIYVLEKFFPRGSDDPVDMSDFICDMCHINWKTPTNTFLYLPVNHLSYGGYTNPFRYFWTHTRGEFKNKCPFSTERRDNGYWQSAPSFEVSANSFYEGGGQTVIRGIFAYRSPDPILVNVSFKAKAEPPWTNNDPPFEPPISKNENITFLARLYSQEGGLEKTYLEEYNSRKKEIEFYLPATECPKVLWLGAAIQPTGDAPLIFPPICLPWTTAEILFHAFYE